MSVQLDYRFVAEPRPGADPGSQLHNPLLAMLDAIRAEGSIARAALRLGLSYRHLWGELKRHEAAFGQPLLVGGQGRAAQLSAFGERLVWAEKRALARLAPQAESVAARLDRELLLAGDPGLAPLTACAAHDPLFGVLREQLRREARVLLDVDYAGGALALDRLGAGACTLAGIHLPLDDEHLCRRGSRIHVSLGRALRLGTHKLIRFVRREQGLMVAPGNPLGIASLADLARPGVIFVNRARGSDTRLLFDELLRRAGGWAADIEGHANEEPTHLAVAATVAAGAANCGFGLHAAAARFGLDFVPIAREQYFLVCLKAALDTPALRAVLDVLRADAFREIGGAPAGYDAAASGEIVSLRRTLPWYK